MKIGNILGALSPGLSATGLFGNAAQGTGMGMLGAMSPLLGLMLLLKKKKGGKDDSSAPADPNTINVTQSPLLRQMGAQMPPGIQQLPFGQGGPGGMY